MQRDVVLREPPWSQSAEMSVLGALLLDNSAWDVVGDLVRPEHFFAMAHRSIYESIGSLILSGKPADVVTVFGDLQRHSKAADVGGLEFLDSLVQYRVSPANARAYATMIAEQALLRGLVSASDEIASLAFDATGLSVADRMDQAQQALQAVQVHTGRTAPTAIAESVVALLDRIQNRHDGTEPRGISTGISDLDRLLGGGFKGGKQIILAARPSIGKSSLLEQLLLNVAKGGHAAAMFSQEMGKDELVDRGVANLGRLELGRVISGDLGDDDWSRLTDAVERMRDLPLFLDDQPALTLHDISAKARALKRQHNLKVLGIDYIQLCGGGADKNSRHHQIEQLSRGLKNLSKQLDITIITLSQLNREVEKRPNGRPILSDLKESGSIEEDADVVMLLSRQGEEQGGCQAINCDIPKNRQGRTGGVTLGFTGQYQQWTAMAAPLEFRHPPRKHYTEDV